MPRNSSPSAFPKAAQCQINTCLYFHLGSHLREASESLSIGSGLPTLYSHGQAAEDLKFQAKMLFECDLPSPLRGENSGFYWILMQSKNQSFIQTIFIEHLLCARTGSALGSGINEQNRQRVCHCRVTTNSATTHSPHNFISVLIYHLFLQPLS